ncbi:hypothetical protein [Paraburkholderia dipogonis]|uniref:hypothetical protein n=1 Tax=Paraburkholderia dipogonis TaxID=1211383 RepID=UPI0038B9435E
MSPFTFATILADKSIAVTSESEDKPGSPHKDDILRWVEAHPALAAWVQAVGSVFAVTATASLPFIHGYLTEKRENKVRLAALVALAQ